MERLFRQMKLVVETSIEVKCEPSHLKEKFLQNVDTQTMGLGSLMSGEMLNTKPGLMGTIGDEDVLLRSKYSMFNPVRFLAKAEGTYVKSATGTTINLTISGFHWSLIPVAVIFGLSVLVLIVLAITGTYNGNEQLVLFGFLMYSLTALFILFISLRWSATSLKDYLKNEIPVWVTESSGYQFDQF